MKDEKKNTVQVSEEEEEEEVEEVEEKNIFKETVIDGKRHHKICTKKIEQLHLWLEEHLEDRENSKVKLGQLYEKYVDMCVSKFIRDAALEDEFRREVNKKYPNGYGIKEDSNLKGKVKEIKVKKPSDKPAAPKVDTKAVLKEALMDLKNPREGIFFSRLRKFINSHHPELQYEARPDKLLTALNMGMRYNYIVLVSGINKLGRYRFWSEEVEEEDRKADEEEKRLQKEKREAAKKAKQEAKDSGDGEKEAEGDVKKEEEKADDKGKEAGDQAAQEAKKKKKKAKKRRLGWDKDEEFHPKVSKTTVFGDIKHGCPQRIEHTFPLAITYMAEPKESTFGRISQYFEKYYKDVQENALMKSLENGESKGYWCVVRGTGKTAVYELTVDSFDPSDDDDGIGKIINAIVASNEPKACSVSCIKDYLVEFHPSFKVATNPHFFKKALERGISSGIVDRLSGIGQTGSFQLSKTFIPSPATLQGSDEQVEREGEGNFIDVNFDASQFQDEYRPRATKRHARASAAGFDKNSLYMEAAAKKLQPATKRKSRPAMKRIQKKPAANNKKQQYQEVESSEEEESESEEEVVPAPKQRTPGSKRPAPAAKAKAKGKSVAAKGKKGSKSPSKPSKKSNRKSTSNKKKAQPESEEEEESEEEDTKPTKRAAKSPKSASKRAVTNKRSYKEESNEESSDEEDTKPTKRAAKSPKSASKRSATNRRSYKEESNEELSDEDTTSKKKKTSKSAKTTSRQSTSKKRSYKEESNEEESADEESAPVKKAAKPSKEAAGRRSVGNRRSYKEASSEEESSDEEHHAARKATPSKKKTPKKVKASVTPTMYKTSEKEDFENKNLVTPASRKFYPKGKSPPSSSKAKSKGKGKRR